MEPQNIWVDVTIDRTYMKFVNRRSLKLSNCEIIRSGSSIFPPLILLAADSVVRLFRIVLAKTELIVYELEQLTEIERTAAAHSSFLFLLPVHHLYPTSGSLVSLSLCPFVCLAVSPVLTPHSFTQSSD